MSRPIPVMASVRPDLIDRARNGLRSPEPIPMTHSISGEGLAGILGLLPQGNVVYPNERNVTGLPAVQAGIDMIAHAVATMMTAAEVFDADDNEIEVVPNVVTRPTSLLLPFEFWTQAVDCAMKRGNYIGILADFDVDGFAQQIIPVHPDTVSLDDSTGIPYYNIGQATYRWDEVVHVRHGAPVGSFWGQGIIERYRQAASRQLHEQEWARSSFASGGVPSGVISLEDRDTVDAKLAEQVQDRWIERHGGAERKPAVFGRMMKFEPISWTPEDAQFIEARQFSVAEAALMCGLDPADLGASIGGNGLTYANLTDRQLSRILQSFAPWMLMFEQAWSDLLPDGISVRGKAEALLRTSTKDRFETYEIGKRIGLYTDDELREIERRPKITTPTPTPSTTPPPAAPQEDDAP